MLSLVQPHHYYQNFLSQGVGMGIGMGLMMLPSLTVTSHYFRVKRSLAMGITVAGSSLGGCLYPILLNNLFEGAPGFGWAVRAAAFMDLGLLIIANLIMRTRLPPKRNQGKKGVSVFKEVISDVPYLIYMFGTFLLFWGIFVPFFYLQLYSSLHGIDPNITKYSITIMNAASVFGRTVPNFVADYFGPLNVMIPSSIISAGLIFAMLGASSVKGVVSFAIFYGFFSGGVVSLATPAASTFATRQDLSDMGLRLGLLSFTLAFALLTGTPIAGALLSPPKFLWHRPLIFAAVVVIGGAIIQLTIWRTLAKRRGRRNV